MKISKSQRAVYIMISILVAVVFWLYVDNTGANQRDVRLYNGYLCRRGGRSG